MKINYFLVVSIVFATILNSSTILANGGDGSSDGNGDSSIAQTDRRVLTEQEFQPANNDSCDDDNQTDEQQMYEQQLAYYEQQLDMYNNNNNKRTVLDITTGKIFTEDM